MNCLPVFSGYNRACIPNWMHLSVLRSSYVFFSQKAVWHLFLQVFNSAYLCINLLSIRYHLVRCQYQCVHLHRLPASKTCLFEREVVRCDCSYSRRSVAHSFSKLKWVSIDKFHQVFAGAVVGLVFGAIWYWIVNTMLVDYFPMIEESAIGRWLYIKDTSHIPDVLKFEYDNARAARKKVATDWACKSSIFNCVWLV